MVWRDAAQTIMHIMQQAHDGHHCDQLGDHYFLLALSPSVLAAVEKFGAETIIIFHVVWGFSFLIT
jgi:hypothetical protein